MVSNSQRADGVDRVLPENDGMHTLRQKLQEIRALAVSTEEKALRMHELMMAGYTERKSLLEPPPSSPPTSYGGERDERPHSPAFDDFNPENPYNIHPGDLDPTFSPLSVNPTDLEAASSGDESDAELVPDLGCAHYKRNVKLQCFDCRRWFPCRHCHDHASDLPFPHVLNRKKTKNMLCMLCLTPQPAAEVCVNCNEYAAWYYCPKCKLWDNDSNKAIYHCDDCGICRVGEGLGKDFVHCRRCNVCISISTSASHPCIERATEGNCPLCLVPLFESRTPVVSLPCGHYMHGDCYKDLMAVTYKCPVCSKSAINMELQWRKLDDEIQLQPMPENDEDLDGLLPHVDEQTSNDDAVAASEAVTARPLHQRRPRRVWVACNDCGGRSWTPFHWLGLKCQTCDSYNTNQIAPTAGHETETERVLRQQRALNFHDFTGNAVLHDAGIATENAGANQRADSALDVPRSPSNLPSSPAIAAAAATTPQSPGRYFVQDETLQQQQQQQQQQRRRPSFTTARFSAPSISNLPTLADMPRMPRMPNIELPRRFSPYEMLNAVSRSLSPMRYYLQGLDLRDGTDDQQRQQQRRRRRQSATHAAATESSSKTARDASHPVRPRPISVQSEPLRSPLGPQHVRPRSSGSVELESWDEEVPDGNESPHDTLNHNLAHDDVHSSDEDASLSEESDGEDGQDDQLGSHRGEIDIFGHR